MKVLNFTQHRCTEDQLSAGIIDCPEQYRQKLSELLTFDELPSKDFVWQRAMSIASLFEAVAVDLGFDYSNEDMALYPMIGGAPFLMSALELAFDDVGLHCYYAFSKRESVEQTQEDGSVRKVAVFRHVGLY